MKITIISVGKIKEKYLNDAINEYEKRISKYAKVENIILPDEETPANASKAQEAQIIDTESKRIIKAIPRNSFVIVLDIKGEEIDSVTFSKKIDEFFSKSSNLTFIIGGSLGMSSEVKRLANYRLSFSPMTFPHMLMKVIMLEQIYRAFKILNNETYHK